tara:strand:- start:1951 stop:2121 length:171 start_codon:yes stop_codon:yes gene_type:complete
MMIKGAILKLIISSVIKGIEKVPDKRIASNHEKRILKLEKDSHPKKNIRCNCKCQK